MFASVVTESIEIGDVTVTIQKLNWKKLREAAQVRSEEARATMKALPQAMLDQMARGSDGEKKAPEVPIDVQRTARYTMYDRDKVLRAGVKAWTAQDRKLPGALDELDEEVAEQLLRAILDLSLPPLEPGVEEAARKNS